MPLSLAVIGGSGLLELESLRKATAVRGATTYGPPSADVQTGWIGDVRVAFLPRHGVGHAIPPHRINHRANLWALKELGVKRVLGTSSVGSLKKEIRPGTLVVPDDYLCLWDGATFHDDKVVHATPGLDVDMRTSILAVMKEARMPARARAVYAQTRGPRLETKAEIRFLRDYADVVGMTMASEATLAAELGLPYAGVCTVDNYAHGVTPKTLIYEGIAKTQRENAKILGRLLEPILRALGKE